MKKILRKPIIAITILSTALCLNGATIKGSCKEAYDQVNSTKSITYEIAEKNIITKSNMTNFKDSQISKVNGIISILDDITNYTIWEINKANKNIEAKELAKEREEKRAEIQAEKERQAELALYTASNTYSTPSEYYTTDGLNKRGGVNYYGDQKETYYNLDMNRVVNNAQSSGVEGEYWVREDGVKMYGPYVIVAANQDVHPYGSTVETSLGEGIVIDSCEAANTNPTQVDIATEW